MSKWWCYSVWYGSINYVTWHYELYETSWFQLKHTSHLANKIMISYERTPGRYACKQYVLNKPHPWGSKYILCSLASGILHDFIFYTGKYTELIDPDPSFDTISNGVRSHCSALCIQGMLLNCSTETINIAILPLYPVLSYLNSYGQRMIGILSDVDPIEKIIHRVAFY